MRSLRLFRAATPTAGASADAGPDAGLLAFASETGGPVAPGVATRPPLLADMARTHLIIAGLAVLVVLQAVPTALWVKGFLTQPALPSAAASSAGEAAPPVPAPPVLAGAPPCEAAPAAERAVTRDTPKPAATAGVAPAHVAGFLTVTTPVSMRVYENGRLVGTTEAERIMLPVGTHELTLESVAVGFQARRTVTVQAGRTSTLRLEAPMGTLHVNAIPWAEVWIDDRRVGETPLGNLQAPIGSREVVFRHPELGERRASVLVTLREPARVSMDLRKK